MAFGTYFIPNGPGNLATLFPDVDFSQILVYYVRVLDDTDTAIAQTTLNYMNGECCDDRMRIHFLNFLGGIDAINFKVVQNEFAATSDRYQRPTPYPLVKSQHGTNRYNVKANQTVTLELQDYPQEANEWVNEFIATPKAWEEWPGADYQDPDYLPIIIEDAKILDQTENDVFNNIIRIQMTYSYDKFIIRN
jgi:hypothetical protein